MTQPMPREPHEGIKADANPESEVAERDQSSYVARGGSSGGIVDSGDPLAGVTASMDDMDEAVSGDTGPAHPGQR